MKKIVINNRNLHIFISFFILYIFLGFCLSYIVNFRSNLFFGADNNRVFLDLTNIPYNHYRIKVHPLFLLLVQPIELIINGVINNSGLSVMIMESFAGAASVTIFRNILAELEVEKKIAQIVTLLYGFSFSLMIFSSIPETFIFAGVGLITYWYFVLKVSKETTQYTKQIKILFVVFGIISFGITLTNYLSYLIGLIYIIAISDLKIKEAIKKFFTINIINGVLILILCVIQKMIWSQCPIFLESILKGILGRETYEETYYMNWSVNLDKTIVWFKETMLHSIVSPSVYQTVRDNGSMPVEFSGYSFILKIFVILYIIIALIAIYRFIIGVLTESNIKKKGYMLAITVAVLINLGLHYIYGSYQAFMYTPHYIFLFLIIMALGINYFKKNCLKKIICILLMLFISVEVINNIYEAVISAQLALSGVDKSISWTCSIIGTLICGILCYLLCLIIDRTQSRKKIMSLGTSAPYSIMLRNILIYFSSILICCIFISFNYKGLTGFMEWILHIMVKLFG